MSTITSGRVDSRGPAAVEEVSLVRAVSMLVRHRVLIIVLVGVLAVPAAIRNLLKPRTYTSSSLFMTQSARQGTTLSSLAEQFGISAQGGDLSRGPAFYVDLLRSRPILDEAVNGSYPVSTDTSRRISLEKLFHTDAKTPALRHEAARSRLQSAVSPTVAAKTGVIELTVTTEDARVSQAVNERLLALVNDFNSKTRQGQATLERRSAEQSAEVARRELRDAEDSLQLFLQHNRVFGTPELSFTHDRLEREVIFRQGIYTSLAQAYEQAKLDEARDMPVITVLAPPDYPLHANGRGVVRSTVAAGLAGLMIGILVAFLIEYVRFVNATQPDNIAELRGLVRDAWTRMTVRSRGGSVTQ